MSTAFARAWLALREPADIEARDPVLLGRAAALLDKPDCLVVDLGAGTGATVRALSPLLRGPARWRLIDHDRSLLQAAERTFAGDQVETVELDLAQSSDLPLAGASLVTASAFFDLCSAAFIAALADRLACNRLSLYAALTYDGTILWEMPHRDDARMVALFNRHQRSDKGLGPALGPDAGRALADALARLGYGVTVAPSPWRLSRGFQALQTAFIDGVATAIGELQEVEPSTLEDWRRSRLEAVAAGASCLVGHLDILALPPGSSRSDSVI